MNQSCSVLFGFLDQENVAKAEPNQVATQNTSNFGKKSDFYFLIPFSFQLRIIENGLRKTDDSLLLKNQLTKLF